MLPHIENFVEANWFIRLKQKHFCLSTQSLDFLSSVTRLAYVSPGNVEDLFCPKQKLCDGGQYNS
jgi:hypothetical protein